MEDFAMALLPFGYLDIERAKTVCDEAGIEYSDIGEYLEEFMADAQMQLKDIDIVALVYEYILQNVRTEIEERTGKDIVNDYNVYVAGNYMATSYDGSKLEKVYKLIKTIPEKSKQLEWFTELY